MPSTTPKPQEEEEEKQNCVICRGTGIQEETMKGYRRYKCWCCDGTGEQK